MLSKAVIQSVRKLHRKKERQLAGLFIVEGVKVVSELLGSNYRIEQIYATEEWKNERENECVRIAMSDLERISCLQQPNQVLAVVRIPDEKPRSLNCWTLVLDDIRDPGNLGTLIRIADWFGIDQIVCSEETVDCFNPKVVQSAMGSLFRVNCSYGNLSNFLGAYTNNKLACVMNGENILQMGKQRASAVIIGNEANGIRSDILKMADRQIGIKGFGRGTESLNAAVAAGIVISHLKQD